jgi:hypothetical protein
MFRRVAEEGEEIGGAGGEEGDGFAGGFAEALEEGLAVEAGEEEDGLAIGEGAEGMEIAFDFAEVVVAGGVFDGAVFGAGGGAGGLKDVAVEGDFREDFAAPAGVDFALFIEEGLAQGAEGGGAGGAGWEFEEGVQIGADLARGADEAGTTAEGGREGAEEGGGGEFEGGAGGGGETLDLIAEGGGERWRGYLGFRSSESGFSASVAGMTEVEWVWFMDLLVCGHYSI